MGKKPETKEVRTPRVHAFRVLQSVGCFVMDMPEKGPAREVWRGRMTKLTVSLKKAPDTEVPEILSQAVTMLGQLAANSVLARGWLSMAVNPDHKTVYVHGQEGKETHEKRTRVCVQ
jgi:hypothetical protein